MANRFEDAPATEPPADAAQAELPSKRETKRALELVAMRGRDVLGVRHLMEGGRALLGNGPDAIARIPLKDLGGSVVAVGEVTTDGYIVRVPPRARARIHECGGLARLVVGPTQIALREGDRAVVVLGPIAVRAKVVPIQTFARSGSLSTGALRWLAVVGALYVAALAICAALAQPAAQRLPGGSIESAVRAITIQSWYTQ